ncbi:MAG: EsaB/YukD family protein [Armatimonadota bacterium]|nr:Mov34/MPN/PAD-1 family protein [bacterium]
MRRINATIMDVAGIRAYDCRLPDDCPVGKLAARLAEVVRFPVTGPDDQPMEYGLIAEGGSVLDSISTLAQMDMADGTIMRLVPVISAGKDVLDFPFDEEAEIELEFQNEQIDVEVLEERPLLHDSGLELRLDVRIDAQVHREIEQFAEIDRHKECAGLLLGKVTTEGRDRVIQITAFVPAEHASGTRTNVTIGLDAWASMLRVREERYPDLRILGWFHTHAGWGVFMSDSDVFIQRHFFPHPNMVAFVLDPTIARDGFFFWHEGKISLCGSYGIVSAPVHTQNEKKNKRTAKKTKRPDLRDIAIGLLIASTMYFGFTHAIPHQNVVKPAHVSVQKQVSVPVAPVKPVEKPQQMRMYVLGRGENLWMVCNRVYNNGDLAQALADYNGIKDLSGLQVGQEIKLPPAKVLEQLAQ